MKTLKNLFLNELADMYDAERRVVKALPKMAKAATCEELRKVIQAHTKESEGHVTKLDLVFQAFDEKPRLNKCEATVGLLEEGDEVMVEFNGSPAINAGLVSIAQKVEHYEMASYGCLQEWAGLLGNKKAALLLQQILAEEKAANETLTKLARATCNQEALGEGEASPKAKVEPKLQSPVRGIRPASGSPDREKVASRK